MRVITWNVNRRTRQVDRQVARIAAQGPDILVLQEVTPGAWPAWSSAAAGWGLEHGLFSLDHRPQYLRMTAALDERPAHGVAVLSRWPLERQPRLAAFPCPDAVLVCEVDAPFGPVELHAVHVPNGSGRGPVEKLGTFDALYWSLVGPADGHRLLCGDFNSPAEERPDGATLCWYPNGAKPVRWHGWGRLWHSREWQVMRGLESADLTDVWRILGGTPVDGWSHRCERKGVEKWRRRFDHIFANRDLGVVRSRYLHDSLAESDHAAVLADFQPRPFSGPSQAEPAGTWEMVLAGMTRFALDGAEGLADPFAAELVWLLGRLHGRDLHVEQVHGEAEFLPYDHAFALPVWEEGPLELGEDWETVVRAHGQSAGISFGRIVFARARRTTAGASTGGRAVRRSG